MDKRIRDRGWSIQSSDEPSIGLMRNRAESMAHSEMTEQSLSHEEKVHLMQSAFVDVQNDPEHRGNVVIHFDTVESFSCDEGKSYNVTVGPEKSYFSQDQKDHHQKRRKTADSTTADDKTSDRKETDKTLKIPDAVLSQQQRERFDSAKNKLSKWAARLFDPNRPRGLVEPPQSIPLNDEFLTAFGKREKEYDELAGREINIDKTSLDIIDVFDSEEEDALGMSSKDKEVKYGEMSNCKVKISNLNYASSTAVIARVCEEIGPVVDVNLLLDERRQSTGRAYVVFESHETAIKCTEKLNEQLLDGRVVRVSLASASSSNKKRESSNGAGGKKDNRYWERDISSKCGNCGEVGHTALNCPHGEDQFKHCGLCAEKGHEMWNCPLKSICFNCGVPGHISRDCHRGKIARNRLICSSCHSSGHHRWACRENPWEISPQGALCMECGEEGHLMCSEMRWFFGLTGVTCYNCGRSGHYGNECKRPTLDVCAKNAEVAKREVELSDSISLSDQLSRVSHSPWDRKKRQNGNGDPSRIDRTDKHFNSRRGDNLPQRTQPQSTHLRF